MWIRMNMFVWQVVLGAFLAACGLLSLVNGSAFISRPTITVISEGETVQFCVSLTEAQDGTVNVNTLVSGETKVPPDNDADLIPLNEVLTFSATGPTEQCLDLIINEDDLVEGVDTFDISISSGQIPTTTNEGPASISFSITDLSRIEVSFTQPSFTSTTESDIVSVCAEITDGRLARVVAITFQSETTGTAQLVDDYFSLSATTRSFSPTSPNQQVCAIVTLNDDTNIEEDETVIIRLDAAGDAVDFIQNTAPVIISDDEGVILQVVTNSQGFVQVIEGNSGEVSSVSVDIMVSWPSGHTLQRNIVLLASTEDLSAMAANNDFMPLDNEQLTIPSTASNGQTFTFDLNIIIGDDVIEESEFFTIRFSAENGQDTFINSDNRRVLIADDGDVIRDCGALEDPTNGNVVEDPNTLQDAVATYTCIEGYNLANGQATRTCLSTGWEGTEPTCEIVDCGIPPNTPNGIQNFLSTTFGAQAIYSCDSGYEFSGGAPTMTRGCLATGEWSGDTPVCNEVNCGFLPEPDNGLIRYPDGGIMFQDRAVYQCDSGYNLQSGVSAERTCGPNRQWSGVAPLCEPVDCGGLNNPENGVVEVESQFFPGTASYTCNTNFGISGDKTRMCQADTTWSGEAPTCEVIECPDLPNPTNGVVTEQVAANGDITATYVCDEGFDLVGNSTRDCLPDEQWSGTAPTCQIIQCPTLTDPTNGQVDVPSRDFQSEAVYTCDVGYNLVGANATMCQANGMWSNSEPECRIVVCPDLGAPSSGSVEFTSTNFGSVAMYTCNLNFMLNGDMTRTCQGTGMWSGAAPICDEILCDALDIPNSQNISKTDGNRIDSVATIECKDEFKLEGESELTCETGGTWSASIPQCEAIICPDLTVSNGMVSFTNGTNIGSVANTTCNEGFEFDGPESRTCMTDGTWSGEESNFCNPTTGGTDALSSTLSTPSIIGIAIGGAVFLIILIVVVTISIVCFCTIRRKKIYKKYVLPYRSYIYANSQRTNNGPVTESEIRQWESQTRQHAVDAVDALAD